jgi:hypothetical protein
MSGRAEAGRPYDGDAPVTSAEKIRLGQPWPGATGVFTRTSVRVTWTSDSVRVSADLEDADVFTSAPGDSCRLWEMGDVFEMFFQAENAGYYVEMHVAPGNQRLHLRIPIAGGPGPQRKDVAPENFFVDPPRFSSRTARTAVGWTVDATVPCCEVSGRAAITPGERWLVSFCRYDAWSDSRPPVLSSSSPHAEPNFHRRHEWRSLCF